jgi:hypothetical protein
MSIIGLKRDDHLDARAVYRRAHRLRARPLEALRQQRRRVPQGALTKARITPTSPKAPAESGNACTMTGPIPIESL